MTENEMQEAINYWTARFETCGDNYPQRIRVTFDIPRSLMNEMWFVSELIKAEPYLYFHLRPLLKVEPKIIKNMLQLKRDGRTTVPMNREHRVGVAYAICKDYPEYQNYFGERLKKLLNGSNIIDYIEKRALVKKLSNELKAKPERARRKI